MQRRECSDQTFVLGQVIKNLWAQGSLLYFVDLETVYNKAKSLELWDVLCKYGIDGSLLNVSWAKSKHKNKWNLTELFNTKDAVSCLKYLWVGIQKF